MTNGPWERLTEEDIRNIKSNGSGFHWFALAVIWSVLIISIFVYYGVIE